MNFQSYYFKYTLRSSSLFQHTWSVTVVLCVNLLCARRHLFLWKNYKFPIRKLFKWSKLTSFIKTIFPHSNLSPAPLVFPVYSIKYLNSNTLWTPSRPPIHYHIWFYHIFKLNHPLMSSLLSLTSLNYCQPLKPLPGTPHQSWTCSLTSS